MENIKGFLASAFSGVTFGLIPLFTLPLLAAGAGAGAILAYRFLLAALMMLPFMLLQKTSFKITARELFFLILLSLTYNGSAYCLFLAYDYLSSGVATSVMMIYPIIVMFIMIYFFSERKSAALFTAAVMAIAGVALLSYGEYSQGAKMLGVLLSLGSALFYALYIIIVNQSVLKDMDSIKLTLYVLLFCGIFFTAAAAAFGSLIPLPGARAWFLLAMLAFVSTVVPNVLLVVGIQRVGSVIVSIMGALSPFTAVIVGMIVFGEVVTRAIFSGLFLVFTSVFIVIFSGRLDGHIKRIINKTVRHLGIKLK